MRSSGMTVASWSISPKGSLFADIKSDNTAETEKTETNKLGKTPVWTAERCALCLGCLHRCPKFVINYNNKTQSHGQYLHSKYYKKG